MEAAGNDGGVVMDPKVVIKLGFDRLVFGTWVVLSGLAVICVYLISGELRMMGATILGCVVGSFRLEVE